MYGSLDKLLWKIFSVAKVISIVIVTICLLVAIVSGLEFLFGGGKGFEVPEFSSFKQEIMSTSQSSSSYNYKTLDSRRKIEEEYGDDVEKIVKKYGFSPQAYDFFINELTNMDEKYRDKFMDGLSDFLDDAQDYIKENKDKANFSITDAANYYINAFKQEIQNVKLSEAEAKSERLVYLATFAGSLLIMLGFLLIPLLIQIEKNTRSESLSSSE